MNNFEISMNKSINITCLYLENKIETAFDIAQVQMFTEANIFSAIADFTARAVEAFVNFIRELKEKISNKVTEFMSQYRLKSIARNAEKNISKRITVENYYDEEKLCRLYKEILHLYYNAAVDILEACPDERRMFDIEKRATHKIDNILRDIEKLSSRTTIRTTDALRELHKTNFLNGLEKDTVEAVRNIDKEMQKIFKARDYYGIYSEKASNKDKKKSKKHESKEALTICQRFQRKISSIGQKCAKFCSNNKTAILIGLSAVLSTVGLALNVTAMKERKEADRMLKEQQDLIRRAGRR